MTNIRKTMQELKNLGMLSTIGTLIDFAKKRPGDIGRVLMSIEDLIADEYKIKSTSVVKGKNDFIAIVGYIRKPTIKNNIISSIEKKHNIPAKKVRFFTDNEKIKNGSIEELLQSNNCVGIIWASVPHSITGSPNKKLSHKAEHALTPQGKLILTIKTFDSAMEKLVEKIKKSPLG